MTEKDDWRGGRSTERVVNLLHDERYIHVIMYYAISFPSGSKKRGKENKVEIEMNISKEAIEELIDGPRDSNIEFSPPILIMVQNYILL